MILRRLSQHIKDQSWFAVALDFVIVVAGILLAFQVTNWSEVRAEKAALARAEVAITGDLIDSYVNVKERNALSECRKLGLRALGERLLQPGDNWEAAPHSSNDTELAAFPAVVRYPKRFWKDRIWETELARGSFDLMDPERRRDIDLIFRAVKAMGHFQGAAGDNESRLKILGQANELSRAERHKLFEIISILDEQSVALHMIGQNIVDEIEGLNLTLNDAERKALGERFSILNTSASASYADCRTPITTPFLDELGVGDTP
jgi:hypothetical protein